MRATIGIAGPKNSGKTTFANIVAEEFRRLTFVPRIMNMGDPIHEMLMTVNPIVQASEDGLIRPMIRYRAAIDLYGYDKAKDVYPEVRRLLQHLGTEAMHPIDHMFWTDIIWHRVEDTIQAGEIAIVTGLRFPHELDALNFDYLIYVDRNPTANRPDNHASESHLATIRDRADLLLFPRTLDVAEASGRTFAKMYIDTYFGGID